MKAKTNILFLLPAIAALITIAFLTSCEKEEMITKPEKGSVNFSFTPADELNSGDLKKSAPVLDAVYVSIETAGGQAVYELLKTNLIKIGEKYISESLTLEPDEYKLTDFLVVDPEDNTVYITPKEGSPMEGIVTNALPLDFSVKKNKTTRLDPEVVTANATEPSEFGYSGFTFEVVESFEFMLGVCASDEDTSAMEFTSSYLTVKRGDNIIYQDSLDAALNVVKLPEKYNNFDVFIEKDGYCSHIKRYRKSELALHAPPDSVPLMVTLVQPPQGLKLWNKLGSALEVENSSWGPDGEIVGSNIDYNNVQFDKGAHRTGANSDMIIYEDINIKLDKGCIEFWMKMDEAPATATTCVNVLSPRSLLFPYLDFRYTRDEGGNSGADRWTLNFSYDATHNLAMTNVFSADFGWYNAGDIMHVGLVWDMDEADINDRMRLYIDNVRVSSVIVMPTGAPIDFSILKNSQMDDLALLTLHGNTNPDRKAGCTLDNIKIYDYPKTDFSDRFLEMRY